MDPRQRPRLIEIIQNLRERITEARGNGWLGEIEGLQVSFDDAMAKLNNLKNNRTDGRPQLVGLGIPVLTGTTSEPHQEQENPAMHLIRLISFGYLHLPTGPDCRPVPPTADRIEDVRDRLRDPGAARDILDLDGLNLPCSGRCSEHPSSLKLLDNLADYANLGRPPAHRNQMRRRSP